MDRSKLPRRLTSTHEHMHAYFHERKHTTVHTHTHTHRQTHQERWYRRSFWIHPSRPLPGAGCFCLWSVPFLQGMCRALPFGTRGRHESMSRSLESRHTARSVKHRSEHTVGLNAEQAQADQWTPQGDEWRRLFLPCVLTVWISLIKRQSAWCLTKY